ncbi:MAG TPA: GNAT family N-acetyltransferase [Candidatus Limnocylindria bacterium]|nr:GNAT family N-acetyltransferase [Candidatus Limnocylindria bacterium]
MPPTTDRSAPQVPAGYTIRRPTRADLPAIAEFTASCDLHDTGGVDFTPAAFEMEWAFPRFDPATDAWTIHAPAAELVAYAHVLRRPKVAPETIGWVHPEHRGRGLGGLLVDLTEARVREIVEAPGAEEPRSIVNWTNHAVRDAATLLEARGYRVNRSFWRMSITLGEEEPAAPAWPDGVELRPMRVGVDDEAVYETVVTAFRDHWGSAPLPFPEWREVRMGTRFFDPKLWLLAWTDDRLVGASLNMDEDGDAWVQTLGVLREARGKGLGRALLLESFRAFHRRGRRRVLLGVDSENLTGATRLYENAGMTIDRQYDHWERELD